MKYLTEFHETALVDRAWKLEGVGEGDERILLERFSCVTTVFQSLSEGSQEVCACCPKYRTHGSISERDHATPREGLLSSKSFENQEYAR